MTLIKELKCVIMNLGYWLRYWKIGFCRCCGKFSFWILKSEDAHVECWLDEE